MAQPNTYFTFNLPNPPVSEKKRSRQPQPLAKTKQPSGSSESATMLKNKVNQLNQEFTEAKARLDHLEKQIKEINNLLTTHLIFDEKPPLVTKEGSVEM